MSTPETPGGDMSEPRTETAIQERVEVRLSPSFGWRWRIDGHEHDYGCADSLGSVACDSGGWRPTRAWAVRAGMRAVRQKDRWVERVKRDWEPPTNDSTEVDGG